MRGLLDRVRETDAAAACRCTHEFEGSTLVVTADDCPGSGRLATEEACRGAVVETLCDRDVDRVRTVADGVERAYEGAAAGLLVAAGRFAEKVGVHDERLATLACSDPLGAAHEATGRTGHVSRLAAETGLSELAARADSYEEALRPFVGPTITRARIAKQPPNDARLREGRELDTGAVVRVYDQPAAERPVYHLEPVEYRLDADTSETLQTAYDRLASGAVSGGQRAPGRAVRSVADDAADIARLEHALAKHTQGYGVLTDLFADPAVSDVYATAPTDDNRLCLRCDGDSMRTNVRLTERGIAALASRFRRNSGRAFSRASPTLDATATIGDRRVRVAGVTEPVSDGTGFAFRAHEREAWTLPALVANGTLPADAAALLSVAVERDAAALVAGPRGAGKTTLLGALLWELPADTRTVVIEDTPELPVEHLQQHGRDVQLLRTDDGGGGDASVTPSSALRTALRLGEGVLVLGEVRGEEAAVLYEAMRVGASGSAVLGTIHGDGASAVYERVVSDLGITPSSFSTTDLLVTCESVETDSGRTRRVKSIEEVVDGEGGPTFATLYERTDDGLTVTGRIARGNSHLIDTLTATDEVYREVRDLLTQRASWLDTLASEQRTDPAIVCTEHARRRTEPA